MRSAGYPFYFGNLLSQKDAKTLGGVKIRNDAFKLMGLLSFDVVFVFCHGVDDGKLTGGHDYMMRN